MSAAPRASLLPLVAVAVTLVLFSTSAWLSRFVYVPARVSPADLWAHPVGLAAVALAGGVLGALAAQTARRSSTVRA